MAKKEAESGYECTFVVPLPKDLQGECSICLQVLREPFLVSCCGYRFCHSCIQPLQKRKRPCPLCNSKFSTLPDKQLQRILNEKQVYCTNKESGCPWRGKLVELEDHSGWCSYLLVQCPHCHQMFQKATIELHQIKCSSKLVKCKFCKSHEDTFKRLVSVHVKECPMYPVSCPNDCGSKPFRKNLSNHLDEKCPLAMLDCFFKYAGCTELVARRDMPQHREENSAEHIIMTMDKIEALERENASLKQRLEMKERELIAARKMQTPVPAKSAMEGSRILIVSNLADGTEEIMLKSTFGQFGLVKNIHFEKYSGFACVEYANETSVSAALSWSEGKGIKLLSNRLHLKTV